MTETSADIAARRAADRCRWALLGGVWLLYACFGLTVAAMAPLVGVLTRDLDLSLSAMGGILGAWPLVYIAAAIPAGALLDRIGLRRALFVAALLLALSGALRALAVDGLSLFLAVGVFGLGGPLISSGAPKLIGQWFDERQRGTAIGIYMTGPAVGSIAALALTNSVMMPLFDQRWRWVLACYAGVTLAAGLIWLWLARRGERRDGRAAAAAGFDWRVYPRLLGERQLRRVLLLAVGVFMFNHGLNNWLPEILRDGGMTAVAAGYWAALPVAVGVLGALTIPRYAVAERRVAVLVTLCLCAALTALLLGAGGGVSVVAAALILQGLARSAMMPIAMLLLMETKTVNGDNMGAAGGLFFTAAEVGGVLGPLLIGVLADRSGGFAPALWLLCGLGVALALLAPRIRDRNVSATEPP